MEKIKRKKILIRIDNALLKSFRRVCKKQGATMSSAIRTLISNFVKKYERGQQK